MFSIYLRRNLSLVKARDIKVKIAHQFFLDNVGNEITIKEIADHVGWKESTVKTYYNKKWKGTVLEKVNSVTHKIIITENMDYEMYKALHTQIDPKVSSS